MNHSIEKAISICGSQKALADAVGVPASFVSQWLTGHRPVPPARCRAIEAATGGAVTAAELRPDVFGEPAPKPEDTAAA